MVSRGRLAVRLACLHLELDELRRQAGYHFAFEGQPLDVLAQLDLVHLGQGGVELVEEREALPEPVSKMQDLDQFLGFVEQDRE